MKLFLSFLVVVFFIGLAVTTGILIPINWILVAVVNSACLGLLMGSAVGLIWFDDL